MKKVYIETTVLSYLTARPSKDVVLLAKQKLTVAWWKNATPRFECYISDLVIDEAKIGDASAAKKRLEVANGLNCLTITQNAKEFANLLVLNGPIPRKAAADALHIATAAIYKWIIW